MSWTVVEASFRTFPRTLFVLSTLLTRRAPRERGNGVSGNRIPTLGKRGKGRQARRPAAPSPSRSYWMTVIRSVAGGASGAAAVEWAAR